MTKSKKHLDAERRLPAELHGVLEVLAVEYLEASNRYVGKAYVNYNILADLILSGWRKNAQPPVEVKHRAVVNYARRCRRER